MKEQKMNTRTQKLKWVKSTMLKQPAQLLRCAILCAVALLGAKAHAQYSDYWDGYVGSDGYYHFYQSHRGPEVWYEKAEPSTYEASAIPAGLRFVFNREAVVYANENEEELIQSSRFSCKITLGMKGVHLVTFFEDKVFRPGEKFTLSKSPTIEVSKSGRKIELELMSEKSSLKPRVVCICAARKSCRSVDEIKELLSSRIDVSYPSFDPNVTLNGRPLSKLKGSR
jgi:hypothetical protein